MKAEQQMKEVDFGRGSVTKRILQMAGPIMVAQVVGLLYSIVDRIYLGHMPGMGTLALTGIGLCFPVILAISAYTNLCCMGGAPLCAIRRGHERRRQAELVMNIAATLLLWGGIVLTICGMIFASPILRSLGASEESIHFAVPYLQIYLIGTIFYMIGSGMPFFVNAQGFPKVTMTAVTVGAVTNIILDPLFIFLLGWGIRGAAVATVISQGLSAWLVLRFLLRRNAELQLKILLPSVVLKHWRMLCNILSLGLVAFIMTATNCIDNYLCNSMLSKFGGDVMISVMTVALSIRQLIETPALAICEGTSPILSFNYGAKNGERVLSTFRVMSVIVFCYMAIVWLVIEWKTDLFIRIFTSDEELVSAAVPMLHIFLLGFVFQAFQCAAQSTFKALNKRGRAIFFSLLRKIFIIFPLVLFLPGVFGLGTKGVFYAEPISNIIGGTASFTCLLITLLPELKQLKRSA